MNTFLFSYDKILLIKDIFGGKSDYIRNSHDNHVKQKKQDKKLHTQDNTNYLCLMCTSVYMCVSIYGERERCSRHRSRYIK